MQNWVKMLESLLDRQKTAQPSIANNPMEQNTQRDSAPSQEIPLESKLQQGSDSQLQTLLRQYPQISETFKPAEEFLSNYTKMQTAYYGNDQKLGQNIWSNNQYQTNPVYPYDQGSYGTSNYWNYPGSSNNNEDMSTATSNRYDTAAQEGSPATEYFMPAKSGSSFYGNSLDSFSPTPSPQTYLTPVQAYSTQAPVTSPATLQANAFSDAATNNGLESALMPTAKKVRPWPTPRPFQYNLDLLRIYQERALEKQLLEEERRMQKPTVQRLIDRPTSPLWESSKVNHEKEEAKLTSKLNQAEGKHIPAIRIAQYSGKTDQKDTRVHPWPFALRIKVIPPDGGNYIMRIKGPLDTLAGSRPKFDMAQGRSKGIMKNVQSSQEDRKYIQPLNRNYKFAPDSVQNQNPIVYLKVPRNHQKFIELTTSFPNKEVPVPYGQVPQSRDRVVSLKLPFNVSLATVLKNIYENMFVNYLNKRPAQIIDDERRHGMNENGGNMAMQFYGQGRQGDPWNRGEVKMTNYPNYNSFVNSNRGDLGNAALKPKPFLASNVGGWKVESKSLRKVSDMKIVSPFAKMQLQNVKVPSANAAFNQMPMQRNQTEERPGGQSKIDSLQTYNQFKKTGWRNIYQKLKNKLSGDQRAASQVVQRVPPRINQFRSSKPRKISERKGSAIFPDSIRLRLFPPGNLKLNGAAQNSASTFKHVASPDWPVGSGIAGNLKKKYYAELVIKNPIQKGGVLNKKSSQQWRLAPQSYAGNLKKNKEIIARMLPFQRSIMPIGLLKKQFPQPQSRVQNQYQLSKPLIRQPASPKQIQSAHPAVVNNIKRPSGNRNANNLIKSKNTRLEQNNIPSMITFRQMQIPYRYLVNPVRLGSRWRLVPVTANAMGNQRSRMINSALKRDSTVNLKRILPKGKGGVSQSLLQVNGNGMKQNSEQLYENQIQILRQMQRDLNMRRSEANALAQNAEVQKHNEMQQQQRKQQQQQQQQRQLTIRTGSGSPEVTQLSAKISPMKMSVEKPLLGQSKLGSPLMDKLIHGLPQLGRPEGRKPGEADKEKDKQDLNNAAGKTERKYQVGNIPQEEAPPITRGKPIIVTEIAQTRTIGSPPVSTSKKEESDSSKMLTKFLEETAPSSDSKVIAGDWDERKSVPEKLTDSDIVSKSAIPGLSKAPLSDHEIIKVRNNHLHNRLVRLKRKKIDNRDETKRELQRSKRL